MGTSLSPIGTPSVIAQDSYSTLCQLSRSGPEDFDALLLRLTERRDAHTRYRTTIINKRQIEDLEMQQNRRAEDEKYHASLVSPLQETFRITMENSTVWILEETSHRVREVRIH
jgi:predicted CopG family antitoxin